LVSSSDSCKDSFVEERKDPSNKSFRPELFSCGLMDEDNKALDRKGVDNDWRECHLFLCSICSSMSNFEVMIMDFWCHLVHPLE
jgi:hypothetical protein